MKKYLMVVLFFFLCLPALAIPRQIYLQGVLRGADDSLLSGQYDLTFRIFNVPTFGSPLWTETHNNVEVTNGLYTVVLGSITVFPSNLFSQNDNLYVGIQVESDQEMTPRLQLLSVPYAYEADTLDGYHASDLVTGEVADARYVIKTGDTMTGKLTMDAGVFGSNATTRAFSFVPNYDMSSSDIFSPRSILSVFSRPDATIESFSIMQFDSESPTSVHYRAIRVPAYYGAPDFYIMNGADDEGAKAVLGYLEGEGAKINFGSDAMKIYSGTLTIEADVLDIKSNPLIVQDLLVTGGITAEGDLRLTAAPGDKVDIGNEILAREQAVFANGVYLTENTKLFLEEQTPIESELFLFLKSSSEAYTVIGDTAGSTHSLGALGDLFVQHRLEVDDFAYFDNPVQVNGDLGVQDGILGVNNGNLDVQDGAIMGYTDTDTGPYFQINPYSGTYLKIGTGSMDKLEPTNNDLFVSGSLEVDGLVYFDGIPSGGAANDLQITDDGLVFKVTSSKKFKKDIGDLTVDYSKFMALRPVAFKWSEKSGTPNVEDYGLIAEDLNGFAPELVTYDEKDQPLGVKYRKVNIMLLKVVQDQQKLVQEQQRQIADLKEENTQIRAELSSLETRLGALLDSFDDMAGEGVRKRYAAK